jgi:hypothetical protein
MAATTISVIVGTSVGRSMLSAPSPRAGQLSVATRAASPTGVTSAPPPAPIGYRFENVRLTSETSLCVVDQRLDVALSVALSRWQEAAAGRIPLHVDARCAGAGAQHDSRVGVVMWGALPPGVAGETRLAEAGGTVTSADIVVDPKIGGGDCLVAVLLHELGHTIGLGHEPDDPASIMFPTTSCRPTISSRDAAAVRHLYP